MTSQAFSYWRHGTTASGAAMLLGLIVLEWYQQFAMPLRWRVAAMIAMSAAGIAMFRWLREAPRDARVRAVVGLVLSMGFAGAVGAANVSTGLFYDVSRHIVPAALGWVGATLIVTSRNAYIIDRRRWGVSVVRDSVLVALVAFVAIAVASWFGHAWHEFDETLYAIQAERMLDLKIVQPVDSAVLGFFMPPQSLPAPGGFVTQYPPGWPAVLAVFSMIGLRPLAGAVLGALAVVFVYRLGRQLHSREAGFAAALLLGIQADFVYQGATYFAHTATMAMLGLLALLLLRANNSGERLMAIAAGLVAGVVIATRPFTGVLLGGSIWLWSMFLTAPGFRRAMAVTAWATLGGIGPIVALLAWNNAITGDPLTFGYSALHGSLHGFGFGERGYAAYDESLNRVVQTQMFTVAVATREYLSALWSYVRKVLPLSMVLPIVALTLARGISIRWLAALLFLPLPVVTFFYFGDTARLMVELLPFLLLGLGIMLATMWRDGALHRGAFALLLVGQLATTILFLRDAYAAQSDGFARNGFRFMAEVASLRERRGPLLVFVRETDQYETWFMSLAIHNADEFPGDIIVARDLGARNIELVRRYPTHTPVLLTRGGPDVTPMVELRLAPDSTLVPR